MTQLGAQWLKVRVMMYESAFLGYTRWLTTFWVQIPPKKRQKWPSISRFEHPRTDSRRMTS